MTTSSERFRDLDDEAILAALDGQLARAWYLNDDPVRAVDVADRVLAMAERNDLVEIVADTLVTRGSALVALGRRYEGVGAVETGQRLAAAHSFPLTENRALNNLSSLLSFSDPRAGLEAARAGLAISRRLGIRSFHLMENARESAVRLGEWDWIAGEMSAYLGEDVVALDRTSALTGTLVLLTYRGAATAGLLTEFEAIPASDDDTVKAVSRVEISAAMAFTEGRYDHARSLGVEFGGLFHQALALARLFAARCALLARDRDAAAEDLDVAEAAGQRGRAFDADRTTIKAGIAALDGRGRESLALYREALREWRELGTVWDEAMCAIDMATLLDPSDPEVSAAADSAMMILTRLGAKPFLERLELAMAVRPGSRVETSPTRTATPAEPIAETRH